MICVPLGATGNTEKASGGGVDPPNVFIVVQRITMKQRSVLLCRHRRLGRNVLAKGLTGRFREGELKSARYGQMKPAGRFPGESVRSALRVAGAGGLVRESAVLQIRRDGRRAP